MNRFLAALVGALILVTSPAGAVSKNFTEQVINTSYQLNYDCSATVIKSEADEDGKVETQLLTAAHCVVGKKSGRMIASEKDDKLKVIEERHVIFDVEKIDRSRDLALLELRDTTNLYPVANVAKEIKAELGDVVYAVGYPLGAAKTVTSGLFGGYQELPVASLTPDKIYLRSSPQISPGNSGGALFQFNQATLNYEVIGVTSLGIPVMAHMGLYIKLEDIRVFLGLDRDEDSIKIFAPGFWEVSP